MNSAQEEKRKRHWVIVVSVGFGGLISLLLLGVLLLWLPIWDIGPVDDADMFTEWHPIPAEENALHLLEEDWPVWSHRSQDEIDTWRNDPETYADEIGAFFEETEPLMKRLNAILEIGAVQPLRMERYDDLIQGVPNALDLSRCIQLRLQLMDDLDARMSVLRKQHDFSVIVGGHSESLIHALVAVAIEQTLLSTLWSLLQEDEIPEKHLSDIADILKNPLDMRLMLGEGFRSEYRAFSNAIEDNFSFADNSEGFDWTKHISTYGFLFHPNRSRLIFLTEMRHYIDVLNHALFPGADTFIPWEEKGYPVSRRIRPNMIGDLLLAIMLPSLESSVLRAFIRDAEIQALQAAIALHQYRHTTEEWPENLGDLVPDFLETLPVDPFDGQPMRYLREARLIYSVGPDRVDQGGSRRSTTGRGEAKRLQDMEDLVFTF